MWSEAMSSLAKMYPKLSPVELSAILMKGAAMSSSLERDSGFNSGSSEHEDDLKSLDQSSRDGLISPENSCEDSIEVKLPATLTATTTAITTTPSVPGSLIKNKRKSSEPLRVVAETELLAPLKKRIRYQDSSTVKHEEDEEEDLRSVSRAAAASPFRPWAPEGQAGLPLPPHQTTSAPFPSPADLHVRHPAVTTLHRAPFTNPIEQLQPLALVAKKSNPPQTEAHHQGSSSRSATLASSPSRHTAESNAEGDRESDLAHKLHLLQEHHRHSRLHHDVQHHHPHQQHHHHLGSTLFVAPRASSLDGDDGGSLIVDNEDDAKGSSSSTGATLATQSRNYKNMTRERRIEANARERTRVHTISAAYEKLRRAIPAYSNAQKLSKLSILRIACSYILTLSRMAGEDYSEDASEPSIADCVAMVTRTIQTEGKIRKKKDD
ncbi:uncharacterized protein LOC131210383 [Anopheles bellator]|uniref:uncharacterized protein LOC131210383 n=1 Tax=Anopheles bellator TaxID=139047 RepID=UPI002647CF14|nr:uncharacterized protein LOC131210383 [Anopheles bellator]